jgi:hypothetical protein
MAPPSKAAPSEQTWPAFVQPVAPLAATTEQVPSVAAADAFVQRPPQHSMSLAHASPFWVQNEGALHLPALQYAEQHSPLAPHGLPEVLHAPFSALHAPPSHPPPQHSPSSVHAAPSAMHWLAEQLPLMHANVQQSGPIWHASPAAVHLPAMRAHFFEVGSHAPEQQSPSFTHAVSIVRQAPASSRAPLSGVVFAGVSSSLPHPVNPNATPTLIAAKEIAPRPQENFMIPLPEQ